MSSARRRPGGDRRALRYPLLEGAGLPVRSAYALLVVALAAYWAFALAEGSGYSTAIDGWLVDGLELAACGLCLTAAVRRPRLRRPAAVLACALLAWTGGDIALTIESLGGANPPVPSVADAFYLCFYPLAYTAVVLFLKEHAHEVSGPNWLDGIIASLGSAALCAAFAFHQVLHAAGMARWSTITNLAYPVGDLVLLGLAVGALAISPGRGKLTWAALTGGMTIVVLGDLANLFANTLASSGVGPFINSVGWPTGIVLMSLAPWLRPAPRKLGDDLHHPGFVLPGAAAVGALVIVLTASFYPVDRVALGLAAATLVVAGARSVLSVRALGAISRQRHHQAITDELTGLRNRRYISDLLSLYFDGRQLGSDSRPDMAFLFVDLDRFKEINDSFGHPSGDELLQQLGARLQACVRDGDVTARLGGDEFAVMLQDVKRDRAIEVAERISATLREPFGLRSFQAHIGASIGIAMASEALSPSELMWNADAAMYRAKQAGTGFVLHGEGPTGRHRLELIEDLKVALGSGQLVLHYQPLLDLQTRQVVGVEALVRWVHPVLGLVPPLDFIPLAEDAGLMGPITEQVLHQALRQVAAWREAGHMLTVSVNVAPSTLLEPGFVDLVDRTLALNGLTASALVVEITESVILDFDRCRQVVEELRRRGVVVSIDDFGAGATSLVYLSGLGGVGELKLDRSFIAGLAHQERELELVRATVELGHAMGLRVVAEGIEDAETLDLIASLGCDLAQGYHISRPRPAPELAFRSGPAALDSPAPVPAAAPAPVPAALA